MAYRPKIPTLKLVKEGISQIKEIDWSLHDVKKVHEYVHNLDQYFIDKLGFVLVSMRVSNTKNLPKKVYRVRKYNENINALLINEFSSPPAALTTEIQRANMPYHPVFYCAPSAHTALLEVLYYTHKKGQENKYFISEWSFKDQEPVYITPFIFGKYDKVELFNQLSQKGFEDFKSKIPDITTNEEEALREILQELSGLFEQKNVHYLSAYLGHTHLYLPSNIRTDVFMYPSIVTDKASINFAIHPNTVIHKMNLHRVFLVDVNEYELNTQEGSAIFSFNINNRLGINNSEGYFIWRDLPEEHLNDFQTLFPDMEPK